jgi:hypothetical protein
MFSLNLLFDSKISINLINMYGRNYDMENTSKLQIL